MTIVQVASDLRWTGISSLRKAETRDKGDGEINDEIALTSCGNCPSRRRRATPQSLLDTDQQTHLAPASMPRWSLR